LDYAAELKIDENLDDIVKIFQIEHKSVEKYSDDFLKQLNKHNYVTPTSFLELLNIYKIILGQKNKIQNQLIKRLGGGLEKLIAANEAVAIMQKDLKELQPILDKAEVECAATM